jgi:small-conductance mechanosensitive channel
MVAPVAIWLLLLRYLPMGGIMLAFKDYKVNPRNPSFISNLINSKWVGVDNFKFLFKTDAALLMIRNTLAYNIVFIILGVVIPVAFAIMMNEFTKKFVKKAYQTLMFFPYFLSIVIVYAIVNSMFAVNSGVPKTVVRAVCSWWAAENASGPLAAVARAVADVVATPVSPELVKGQRTEETIGPYELHDFITWNFAVNGLDRGDLLRAARRFYAGVFPAAAIARTLDVFLDRLVSQAFKRNCHPDGIRVFPFDFSRDSWSIPSDLPRGIL